MSYILKSMIACFVFHFALLFSFPLQGVWIAKNIQKQPIFHFEDHKITSKSNRNGIVSMTPKINHVIYENQTIVMSLTNLQIEKKPTDWYNVAKYYPFMQYFQKIQQHGLLLWIHVVNSNETVISCQIGHEYWNSILRLTRKIELL